MSGAILFDVDYYGDVSFYIDTRLWFISPTFWFGAGVLCINVLTV